MSYQVYVPWNVDPIILILRLIIPLTIFRFPFWGGVAALWLDGIDWNVNFFHIANIHANYVLLDKILDLYYFSIEAFVLLRWRQILAKRIAVGLFVIRAIGIILLTFTAKEYFLFYFPNVFENFYLFYYGVWTLLGKEPKLSTGVLLGSLAVLAVLKLIQEYTMHVLLISNWRFISLPFLPFTYDNLYHQIALGILLILFAFSTLKRKVRF